MGITTRPIIIITTRPILILIQTAVSVSSHPIETYNLAHLVLFLRGKANVEKEVKSLDKTILHLMEVKEVKDIMKIPQMEDIIQVKEVKEVESIMEVKEVKDIMKVK